MMNTSGEGVRNNIINRYPFTAGQWQELEQQALAYKYIISGMQIPPHLLFTIKTSLDSSTNLTLHHHPPHLSIGWNCFQMGFGRKIDPEPGRCRRTDGKKWRCSKEAYPDSKYCERHMHRGKNRSRKPPVEVNMSTPKTTPSSLCIKSPNYPSPNSLSSSDCYNNNITNLTSDVLSSQDYFLLNSSPYRKSYGMKEEMDEHSFFSESSGMGDSKQKTFSEYHENGGYSSSYQQEDHEYQVGFNYYDQLALKLDRKDEPQKVIHRFFDEWPPNDDTNKDFSSTQLSISIPDL